MALPLLFIVPTVLAGSVGAFKTAKASKDTFDASKITKNANEKIKKSSELLSLQRVACSEALENTGRLKVHILNTSISEFLDTFQKIKNVDFEDAKKIDENKELNIDKKSFEELEEMRDFALSIFNGTVTGTTTGALIAIGSFKAATLFASASTGTAIVSLSGIAATNATLAFFGGGSLATGGLGVVGGTAILGVIASAPALLIIGFIAGAKANEKLDTAYTNDAKANEISKELDLASLKCESIRRKTYTMYNLLSKLDSYFLPLIYRLEEIVNTEGLDYSKYSEDSKKAVASATSIAITIKTILDKSILDSNGDLSEESENLDSYIANN